MREFLDAIYIFTMTPRNDLLSDRMENEAYCLAEPGRQYAVFFTVDGDGCVRIKLAASRSPLQLRWLDVTTSCWEHNATVPPCNEYIVKTPGRRHWVAVLTAANP
jgi:hypothetical protein